MIVVRSEYKLRHGADWGKTLAFMKAHFDEGGLFHNISKEYRILTTYWSGTGFGIVVEMKCESLGEWESLANNSFAATSPEYVEEYFTYLSSYPQWSYWSIVAEG